ncbi:MAG TPA: hypothetical protein VGC89_18825 [Pyrinomonadaceae bacterium]
MLRQLRPTRVQPSLSTIIAILLAVCLSVASAPPSSGAIALDWREHSQSAQETKARDSSASTAFTIVPSSGVQGHDYEVVLTSNKCQEGNAQATLKDYEFYAPQGSGIRASAAQLVSDCQLTARLNVATDAPLGKATLWLKPTQSGQDKGEKLIQPIEFTVNGVTAGPIPPGLNNEGQVDVMWAVLPDSVVKDNFGGKVSNEYYAVEVVIGNDSGFDIQIASVGFTGGKDQNDNQIFNNKIPSTGFRITRGSLQRRQQLSPRNLLINGLKVFGPFLTGFTPYFRNLPHRTNFSEAINIISNPLEKGLEFVIPDTTIDQLARLGDQAFRDDITTRTVIPNNTQSRILTFVAKDLIFPPTGKSSLTRARQYNYSQVRSSAQGTIGVWSGKESGKASSKGNSGGGSAYNPRNNSQDVMRMLGQLVLIGDQIAHVNRIRVVNAPLTDNANGFAISGTIVDRCHLGVSGVTVKLNSGEDFTMRATTGIDGSYVFTNVPAGRGYTVTPESADATFTADNGGMISSPLSSNQTNINFTADLKTFVITGRITKSGSTDAVDGIEVNLTGQATSVSTTANGGVYTFTVTGSPITGDFRITPKPTDAFPRFEPSTITWNCSHRDSDFRAVPKN